MPAPNTYTRYGLHAIPPRINAKLLTIWQNQEKLLQYRADEHQTTIAINKRTKTLSEAADVVKQITEQAAVDELQEKLSNQQKTRNELEGHLYPH